MADPVRVFVSHHHSPEENAFTARLVADLEAAGADVWVDDARITSDDFIKKINEGLTGRQWLVLVMTPDSLRSEWVQAEVNAALLQVRQGRMLGVIPLVAQTCDDADIPPLWATLQRYDATKGYGSARDGLMRAMGMPRPLAQPATKIIVPRAGREQMRTPWLPEQLRTLGFIAGNDGRSDYIVPPVCNVPAGAFLMGTDRDKDKDAYYREPAPQTQVVAAFQIGKYPVTVAEYECFLRATSRRGPPPYHGEGMTWEEQVRRPDHPVVNISEEEARAYAEWLSKRSGQQWRLPSSMEWEKAARGRDGRIFPWGNVFDASRCNTSEGKIGDTTPIGAFLTGVSPHGIHDMAGNVWEWIGYYGKDYSGDPDVSKSSELRGGSWLDSAKRARTSYAWTLEENESMAWSDYAVDVHGFRLAHSVSNS